MGLACQSCKPLWVTLVGTASCMAGRVSQRVLSIVWRDSSFMARRHAIFAGAPGRNPTWSMTCSTPFTFTIGASVPQVLYAVIHCFLGKYGRIPYISDAADKQVR